MKYTIDGHHLPEREDSSDSMNVHEAQPIQESTSGSASRVQNGRKPFGLVYRSANSYIPQVRKVRFQRDLIYCGLI